MSYQTSTVPSLHVIRTYVSRDMCISCLRASTVENMSFVKRLLGIEKSQVYVPLYIRAITAMTEILTEIASGRAFVFQSFLVTFLRYGEPHSFVCSYLLHSSLDGIERHGYRRESQSRYGPCDHMLSESLQVGLQPRLGLIVRRYLGHRYHHSSQNCTVTSKRGVSS